METVTAPAGAGVFQEGEEVVLTDGPYKSNLGVFVRLKEDPNWADITGRDGKVSSHPVEWLARSNSATPGRDAETQKTA